jgi:uroporphyrinogen decarboxylase
MARMKAEPMLQDFSEGFRRLESAVEEKTDRVPLVTQMHEFAMFWSRYSPREFYTKAPCLVEGIIRTATDFDFDVPSLGYDAYDIEAEAMGQPIVFPGESGPIIDRNALLIPDRRDFDRLKPPDPRRDGRMPFVLEMNRLYLEQTGYPPPIQFCAPLSLAIITRGYEHLVQDLYFEPEFVHRLLSFLTEEVLAPWISAQHDQCPETDIAIGADALASPPLVPPKILEQFAIPYILRLRELCDVQVVVRNWWGESELTNPEELLDLKCQVADQLIEAQDPDVYKIGPARFRAYADRVGKALILGIGESLLMNGPASEIRKRIMEYVVHGGPDGRLILYLCNLSAGTQPEHVRAAVSAVRECGCYEQ